MTGKFVQRAINTPRMQGHHYVTPMANPILYHAMMNHILSTRYNYDELKYS